MCVVLVAAVKLCAVKRATDTATIHLAAEFNFGIESGSATRLTETSMNGDATLALKSP